jgi:hypothetical protein
VQWRFDLVLVYQDRLTSDDLVLHTCGNTLIRMRRMSGVDQRILFNDRVDAQHPDSLREWHEFDIDRNIVSSGVCFEGQCDRVHDLSRPGVLDLQRLVELQSFWGESPVQVESTVCVEVLRKAGSQDVGLELVLNDCLTAVGLQCGGDSAVEHEGKGERVVSGLERMSVTLVAL